MLEEQEEFFTGPHASVHKHKELPGKGSIVMRPGSLLGKSGWRRRRGDREDVLMTQPTWGTPHRMLQKTQAGPREEHTTLRRQPGDPYKYLR